MSTQTAPQNDNLKPNKTINNSGSNATPAIGVALTGQHLIEASAGTGKTWTLTGIVLRLLIEARRPPEQIIATTFTRAAAAEMRQRIHERLIDFYQVAQWLKALIPLSDSDTTVRDVLYPSVLVIQPDSKDKTKDKTDTKTKQESVVHKDNTLEKTHTETQIIDDKHTDNNKNVTKEAARDTRQTWLKEKARIAHIEDKLTDPINLHLVEFLLNHTYTYSLDDAIRRTALVLTTLDNLFVGTLDSLAQKWLTEYSSETGHQQGMAIIEDSEINQITDSIIHDELRQFQSRLYYEQPRIYDLLEQSGKLTTVEDHRSAVYRALSFVSAPIDEVTLCEPFDFKAFNRLLTSFSKLDITEIDAYRNEDYRKSQGFTARSGINTRFHTIDEIYKKVAQFGLDFHKHLSDDALTFLDKIKEAQYPDENGKIFGFKVKHEQQHAHLFELETIKGLTQIQDGLMQITAYYESILAHLNRHIALTVRYKLPLILEERGQTTFTLQMVRLNQALSGSQGEKLARYIRHHYPVALIDESQDINGEQAMMIERIYLSKPTNKNNLKIAAKHKTFLLLVGDPKQAIYGFRGGDVANYNHIKRHFDESQIHTLNINRRSNAALIDGLNHWFGAPNSTAASKVLSNLGAQINYKYITASNSEAKLSWLNEGSSCDSQVLPKCPVGLIHLPYDETKDALFDEYETTAQHIALALQSGHTLNGKPIVPSDIGVLGKSKRALKQVENALVKLGVPTLTTSDVSVFETIMAEDVAVLLAAMLYPYRRDMINRVLTSHLYGLSLTQVRAMMQSQDSYASHSEFNNSNTNGNNITATKTETNAVDNSYQDFISYLKEGAKLWQHRGILSALHYLFENSPVQSQGVWQALAKHPEGERHIMDLRQVMDILAQYGTDMGEHEMLSWFRQNMDAAPSSDWARQYPLPAESGVQLMTIHKSKGLEFPIVYVLGMDKAVKQSKGNAYALYLYNYDAGHRSDICTGLSNNLPRHLSPLIGTQDEPKYFADVENQEEFEEVKRLGYVAFTRASEQLFIVVSDDKPVQSYAKLSTEKVLEEKYTHFPMKLWLHSKEAYVVPDYLREKVTDICDFQAMYDMIGLAANRTQAIKKGLEDAQAKQPIRYPKFNDVMSHRYFSGWSKTSFTALARQLDDTVEALAVNDERIDDDVYIDTTPFTESDRTSTTKIDDDDIDVNHSSADQYKPSDDIRFNFVRGANAGTFLHEIFEKIDFTDKTLWSQVIDRAIGSYQLPLMYASLAQQRRAKKTNNYSETVQQSTDEVTKNSTQETVQHLQLKSWLEEVLHVPLLASGQALVDIQPKQRFAELGFNMGLSETFNPEQINTLFKTYLPDDPDKHVQLTSNSTEHLYRYLRGEIDLVYQHEGKFYVVDYKSNYLGNSLSDYSLQTLNIAMNKAGYWLQAAIYQVALHRFLSLRIKDYQDNEANYLGAVEYVFLRGTYQADAINRLKVKNSDTADLAIENKQPKFKDDNTYGLVTWDIPIAFVKALDALFGRPNA